jgi:hypothetical protein
MSDVTGHERTELVPPEESEAFYAELTSDSWREIKDRPVEGGGTATAYWNQDNGHFKISVFDLKKNEFFEVEVPDGGDLDHYLDHVFTYRETGTVAISGFVSEELAED